MFSTVEDFDRAITYSPSPASLWDSCSRLHTSASCALRGLLPQQAGDSSMLTSPTYDLNAYSHVYLVFDHICKISSEDLACIEIKEDFLGARWHSIASSCYLGKENAYRQQRFSDNSYPLWQGAHPEAVPDNRWWKTECFDLSGEAAYASIQLRFKIKKGQGSSGRFAYGWLIDHIRIYAGKQALPPVVLQLCEPVCASEVNSTGPFRISFRTEGGLPVQLQAEYSVNGKLFPAEILKGDSDTCVFAIPQTPYGQHFTYTIRATDSAGIGDTLQRSFNNPMPTDGRDSHAARIVQLLSPEKYIARTGDKIPLRILMKNTGICDLCQARICWSYAGCSTCTEWNGKLPADYCSDTLSLSELCVADHDDSLKVWIVSANGQTLKNTDTLCFRINACHDFLHGTYRIGRKNADFSRLEEALQQLEHCGLSGNTTFALDSGTYALHLNLQQLDFGNDSLIFTSATGNASDVVWTADSTYGEIIRMEKVHNLCFRNLTFLLDSLHPQAGSVLLLNGNCRNIRVEACRFLLYTTDAQGITSADRKGCSNVDILDNTFTEGRFGVLIWGNITHDYRAFRVEGNLFDRQSYCGLYLMALDFSRIGENTFLSSRTPTQTNRSYTGLELYGCYGRSVEQNRFRMYSGKYAMELGIVLPDSSRYVDIVNNEIYFHCTHAQSVGIMLGSACRNIRFLHNSLLMNGRTNGNCCISVSGLSDSIRWEKNLWVHLGTTNTSPCVFKFTQPVYPYLYSHTFVGNHYYVPYGSYLQTDRPLKHLKEWQQLHGQDAGATEGEVRFADTSRSLAASTAYPLCFSTDEVPSDLNRTERSTPLTTKGAYHGIGSQRHDALAFRLLPPGYDVTPADSLPLCVVLANAGSLPLQTVHIGWEWNGIQQSRFLQIPALACGDTLLTDTLTWLPARNGDNSLKIWTYLPNDTLDGCPANDTLQAAFYACDSALNGDYRIGTGQTDFPDLETAIGKALRCGIRGPVRFLLASGDYSLQLDIEGRIPGSSVQNTLCLTSLAQNADSVRICCNGYAEGQRAAIRLSHTSHWILEHLSIAGAMEPSATYSIAVELMDSCTDIRIRHCMLRTQMPGTSLVCSGIYSSETTGDSLSIQHNILEGGMTGISLEGYSPTSLLKNIRITDNTFRRHTVSSISLRLATFLDISGNTAENLYLQTVNGKSIQANRFHSHRDRCIQLTEIGTLNQGSMLQISNNECISEASIPHCGLEIGPYCHDLNILHNSFSVIGNGEGKCLQLQDDPTLWNIRFQHNLFYQGCRGFDTASIAWSSLRSPSAYSFSNNLFGNPSYVDSAADLRLGKGGKAVCLRLPEVPGDIDGQPRTALTGMGAHILPPCDTDAAVTDLIFLPETISSGSIQPLRVRFGNLGNDTLRQLCFHWEVDGIVQNDVHWQGNLGKGDTASVFLGNFKAARSAVLRIYLEQLSGDVFSGNDSLFRQLTVCDSGLGGELRIGQDFPNLESALQALYRCGIRQDVRIVLPAGTFRGPFNLDHHIPGSDSLHRILLTADSANKTTLTLDNSLQTGQYILRCGHTGHWIFENLCFEIPEKQQEACAIQLLYDCEDIRVNHCQFNLQEHSQAAVYQHTDWGTDGFEFSHNYVRGGRNGLLLSASKSLPDSRFRLCDNLFTELYGCGISLENCSFDEISRNTIEQKKSSSTGFYGMKFQSVKGNCMNANRIRATRGFYGIYLSNTSGNNQSLQISNNEIHLNVPSSNCGIYLYDGCSQLSLYHNSILLEGNGEGKCLYTAFNLHDIALRNNQFTNFSGKSGSTDNPVLYFYSASGFSGWQADYNHYYSIGQALITAGNHLPDIKTWQQKTGKENHSNSFRPVYPNKNQSLRLTVYDSLSCPMLATVPLDKQGMEREQRTQRGCYQAVSTQHVNWELSALESPDVHTACPEAFQEVRIRIRNAGCDTLCLDTHPLCIRILLEGAVRMEQRCFLNQGCLAPLHSESFTLMEHLALSRPGDYALTFIVEDADDNSPDNDTLYTSFRLQRTPLPFSSNMEDAGKRMEFTQVSGTAQWFTDTSANGLTACCGKAKLCFPSAGQRGSIAQASLGHLDLSGLEHPVLSVWYARNSLNKSETDLLRLLVSPEGDSLQEVAVLYRYKANCSQSIWERADIDLSAYSGQCVRIVWEGISYGGGNQYIDSLHLQGRPLLQEALISVPVAVRACEPDARGLFLCISNPSIQAVEEDSVMLTFNVLSPTNCSYSQMFALSLPAYGSDTLTVDADFLWECGKCYAFESVLENAAGLLSDSLNCSISTLTDIGLLQLDRPDCKKAGEEISVSASLMNIGTLDVYGIPVEILMNDTLVAEDTIVLLRQGERLHYTCGKQLRVPAGSDSLYDLEIRIPLDCDKDFSNNSCYVRACRKLSETEDSTVIAETDETANCIQIYPNPSQGDAFLLLQLASETSIRWEIFSPEGQLLYRSETEGERGENRIRLPRLPQAKGLLFVRVHYGDSCRTGKWIRQ